MKLCLLSFVHLCLLVYLPVGIYPNDRRQRQAIPLAVAQSSALRVFPVEKNKHAANTTFVSRVLNNALQNYAPAIKDQAQQDILLRNRGAPLNITESLYNGSVAFAIDNNKTSATQNNTIHLLRNISSSDAPDSEQTVSLNDVTNATLPQNRTIVLTQTNFTEPNDQDALIAINNTNNRTNYSNRRLIMEYNKEVIDNINDNDTSNSVNKLTKNDGITGTNRQIQESLPVHFVNVYYKNLFTDTTKSKSSDNQSQSDMLANDSHGILVGPLDDLPDHPNGNGPQDKKAKDLGGNGNAQLSKEAKNETKKRKPKNNRSNHRTRRQLYNYRGMGMRQPWDYSMNSELYEHNGELEEPTDSFLLPVVKADDKSFLRNLYETSSNANANYAKGAIASRNGMWFPQRDPNFLELNKGMYSGESRPDFDRYFEREIGAIDRRSPLIGERFGIEDHPSPVFPPAPIQNDDVFNMQDTKSEIPEQIVGRLKNFQFTPDSGLMGRSFPDVVEHYDREQAHDQELEDFLNKYDEQTRVLAGLYNKVSNVPRNSEPLRPGIMSDQLRDPDGMLDRSGAYMNRYNSFERENQLPVAKDYANIRPMANQRYQDQRRDILERHKVMAPLEIEIPDKPQNAPNEQLNANLINDYLRSFQFQNQRDPLQNVLLQRLLTNPYKRTIDPSINDLLQTSTLSPQQASEMNIATPDFYPFNMMPADEQERDVIGRQQGVAMLMVTSPLNEETGERKEIMEHRELTHDGLTRASSNVTSESDFSVNLKKAADYVLSNAVTDGNITTIQREEIERKLTRILNKEYKNKTRGELSAITRAEIPSSYTSSHCNDSMSGCAEFKAGGVCPFMTTFMKGSCTKTCQDCSKSDPSAAQLKISEFFRRTSSPALFNHDVSGSRRSSAPHRFLLKQTKVPDDPVMYLTFERANKDGVVEDSSGNKNNALLEKGAGLSPRVLGTCGKAVELNEGSVTWSGEEFKRKPDTAISIAMYVKIKKGGVINWFANGQTGDKTFYTKTKGAVVPAKVWTHVAGTYNSETGLARIYINGDLEQEQTQRKGETLSKNWLVNGIGTGFGDDSLHYADEVVIYDRALSQSEVKMLYNRCMFNRMILHFGFQKGNKTSMSDQSGLENNAILIGGALQKEDCDRCGFCLDLSRGPDPTMKIEQITVKKLPRTKISIALWISLNETKGVHNIFTTESSEGNIGYRLQVVNGKIRWAIGTDTIPVLFDHMTENEVIPEALWTHIIATYSNENGLVKIFANSIEKLRTTVAEAKREFLPTNWDNDASIGDHTLKGYIDEFIMYNWDLDNSEALYVRNYCADHPKLVRFTVRVPLTKKTIVPHISRKGLVPHSDYRRNKNQTQRYNVNHNHATGSNQNLQTAKERARGLRGFIYRRNPLLQLTHHYSPQYLGAMRLYERQLRNHFLQQQRRSFLQQQRHLYKSTPVQTGNPYKRFMLERMLNNRTRTFTGRNWWSLYDKLSRENKRTSHKKTIMRPSLPIDRENAFVLLKRRKKSEHTQNEEYDRMVNRTS